jgi:hypothetical protein
MFISAKTNLSSFQQQDAYFEWVPAQPTLSSFQQQGYFEFILAAIILI